MALKPGTKLFGKACTTEVMVIKAPAGEAEVSIGGHPAVASAAERDAGASVADGADGGTLVGKRYVDEGNTIELLCTKPGAGSLALNGAPLAPKDAKPLPSSD